MFYSVVSASSFLARWMNEYISIGKHTFDDDVIAGGHLLVKILKRTAQFIAQSSGTGIVPPQQIKMLIPKKTKLFMEQTLRERENAVGMFHTNKL